MLPNLSKCAPSAATGASPKTGHILELRTETATAGGWLWSETPLEKARKVLTRHLTKNLVNALENGSQERSFVTGEDKPLYNLSQADKTLLQQELKKKTQKQRVEIRNAIDVYIRHLLNEFSADTYHEPPVGAAEEPKFQFARILRFLSIQKVAWDPTLLIVPLTLEVEAARKEELKIERELNAIISAREEMEDRERAVKLSMYNAVAGVGNLQSQLLEANTTQNRIESTYADTHPSTVDYARLLLHEIVTLYHVELQQLKDGDSSENALGRLHRRIDHARQFFRNDQEFNNAEREIFPEELDTRDQDNTSSVGEAEWGSKAVLVAEQIVEIINNDRAANRTEQDNNDLVKTLADVWTSNFGKIEERMANQRYFDATVHHLIQTYRDNGEVWEEWIYETLCTSYYGQDCRTTMALKEILGSNEASDL